jgi:hypothetical protein
MPGVPRELIEHSLNVDPKATPKRQHLRRFADDRRDAMKKELSKLLAAGFIREVFHPEWLDNPVLVRKKNLNEWRMCVDYTDLNKHCPKDPFGLPRIDQVTDSTAGCDLLCFLDCYSGYHQIAIKEEDQEKTAFITPFGAYCYTTMSFGLKNVGATYQRAIQACFKRQLNKNVEAYVDDVVVKTRNSSTLIADLEETFASLREYRWKLNPNKCVFGVPSGKLLGFIISHRGIKSNPEKISAITNMKAPTCIKDVQKLTGCMAALNRSISKLGERGLPFFKLLKHQEKFVWTPEVHQALAQLKDFLSKPPVLTAPRKGEQLLLYLAATTHVVSTAIIVERQEDGHAYPVQRPVYFVSEVLSESMARYQPVHCTQCSSPRGSYDTTSRSTQSPSSPTTRSATSCGTKMLLEKSPSGQSNSVPSTSTSSHAQPSSRRHSQLHGGVAGESATYSNRAPRALGDLLRRLAQSRRRRCRGTLDLPNGRTTQVRHADLLEGLKQRS